jgi:CelD/BcsL family acetyltransferase involved in cellulose biosynthesis
MLDGELIIDLGVLESHYAEWDALAVENGEPLMAPACVMAWWRHLAPSTAQPRLIFVRDGQSLVGVAPFYMDLSPWRRLDLRLPGIELASHLAPLAKHGCEEQVGETLARTMGDIGPAPDLIALEGMTASSSWASALQKYWPTRIRPLVCRYNVLGCPAVSLDVDSFDAWLGRKSSHARHRLRRKKRQFAAAGGTIRLSTISTLAADVETLIRLHQMRWSQRGGSHFVSSSGHMASLLNDIGNALLREGRFRLVILEIDDEPICAQLAIAAGAEVVGINGGWDERWARLSPTIVAILYLIEDALTRGDRRFQLGPGEQDYKRALSDEHDTVAWTVLMLPGVRLPLTLIRTAPMLGRTGLRNYIRRRASQRQLDRYRKIRLQLTQVVRR